ncbi:uncharacterized protein LOC120358597 [Solenopsis invicta]|uniref:uncharacterized protein LOC120358597 n=1 Tax=Solenopsis invicta TaxID=13686 RepID=UPI00193E7B1E|nr:uncharacterized protein LOC120358597 [Solenopsis invicta]
MDKNKEQTTSTSSVSGLEYEKSYFLTEEDCRKIEEKFDNIKFPFLFGNIKHRRRRELGIRDKMSFQNRSEAGLSTTQAYEDVQWYPFKNTDTVAGKMTESYLHHLTEAMKCQISAFHLLANAEFYHKKIGCEKTIKIWKRLDNVIPMCSKLKIDTVASIIGGYLVFDPDSLYFYIEFLETVKFYQEEEEKVKNLISEITSEFTNRFSTFSFRLARLQKTIKSISSKTFKQAFKHLPSGSSAE